MTRPSSAYAIQLLILDVDGVMTDGRLYFGPRGEALKVFHVRDGVETLEAAGVMQLMDRLAGSSLFSPGGLVDVDSGVRASRNTAARYCSGI